MSKSARQLLDEAFEAGRKLGRAEAQLEFEQARLTDMNAQVAAKRLELAAVEHVRHNPNP